MKLWRRLFQWLFIRQTEQPQTVINTPRKEDTGADVELIRFAVWHHFKYGGVQPFELSFVDAHAAAADELRMEGWNVLLAVNNEGELSYSITPDRSGIMA